MLQKGSSNMRTFNLYVMQPRLCVALQKKEKQEKTPIKMIQEK